MFEIVLKVSKKAKGMKVKLSGNIGGSFELNQNTPYACRFSKGHNSRMA
jgi:hypothetical protein